MYQFRDEVNYDINRVQREPEYLKRIKVENLIAYPEIFLQNFEKNPNLIQYLPTEVLKLYPQLCVSAVEFNSQNLRYIPMTVRKANPELCINATENNLDNFEFLPLEFREQNEELCIKAVKYNLQNIKFLPEEFQKKYPELCLEAAKKVKEILYYISEEVLEEHPEICVEAIRKDVKAFEDVPEYIIEKYPKEICCEAVSRRWEYIKEIPEQILIENPSICAAAISRSIEALKHIPENIDLNKNELFATISIGILKEFYRIRNGIYTEIAIEMRDVYRNEANIIFTRFKQEPVLFLEVIKIQPEILRYLPSDVKNNFSDEQIIENSRLFLEAVNIQPKLLSERKQTIPDQVILENLDIVLEIIKKDPTVFKLISNKVQIEKKEICELAVKRDPNLIGAVPKQVLIDNPEMCIKVISKGLLLYTIPYDIQEKHPEISKKAVELNPNNLQFVPESILLNEPQIALNALDKDIECFDYIPDKILKNNPNVCARVVKISPTKLKHVPLTVKRKYPEISRGAVKQDARNLEFVPGSVQKQYPDICAIALEENINIYRERYFKGRDLEIVKKIMFGEDFTRIDKIKQVAGFENSRNYDEIQMDLFYRTMINTLGMENLEKLIQIPNLSKKEIEQYRLKNDEVFDKLFETKYQVTGDTGIVLDIFRNFSLSQYKTKGKNVQFEIYKNLNILLDGDKITLNELLKNSITNSGYEIDDKTSEMIEKISQTLDRRIIDQNLDKIENLIIEKLEGIVPLQREAAERIIEDNIRDIYLRYGKLDKQSVLNTLEEDLTGENHSPYMRNNKEYIINVVSDILESEGIIQELNKSAFDILKSTKDIASKGWIRKILNTPKELSKEEFEILQKLLNIELEYKSVSQLKNEEDLKEAYKLLTNKSVPEILTYEKVETIFGGIKEPYSVEFREFFMKNRKEILSNPIWYMSIAKIHNDFEEIIKSSEVKQEGLTLDSVKLAFNRINQNRVYQNIERGNEELADLSLRYHLSQKYFDKAQAIFNITKKREESTIPLVRTNQFGQYRGRMLNADDPLILFVGTITDCCQELGNVGESAMIHSATEKNGGVFVVEKLDENGLPTKIVAQSWVWRNGDRLCFDNIELGDEDYSKEDEDDILKIYREAGESALKRDQDILQAQLDSQKITQQTFDSIVLKEVTVGMGFTELEAIRRLKAPKISILPAEKGRWYKGINSRSLYFDSSKQVIVAEMNEKMRREIEQRQKEEKKNDNIVEELSFYNVKRKDPITYRLSNVNQDILTIIAELQQKNNETSVEEIVQKYGINIKNAEVSIGINKDWYVIYENTPEGIRLVEMSNKNSEDSIDSKRKILEMAKDIYTKILQSRKQNLLITSEFDNPYINLTTMEEKGLGSIISEINKLAVFRINNTKASKLLEEIHELLDKVYEQEDIERASKKKEEEQK